jgi:nucleoid DNA-binding protein
MEYFFFAKNLLYQQFKMAAQNQSDSMFDMIASSFFQKKSCRLPGIGNLELVTTPAEYDFGTKQIRAPRQSILFISAPSSSDYFNEFSAISQLMKDALEKNGSIEITGLGSFTKDSSGAIQFSAQPANEDFFQPVTAEKVIHKDAEHSILVGDKETTNIEMNEYYSDEVVEAKYRWWIWAIVLGAVGIIAVAVYLLQHGFNTLGSKAVF